MESPSEEFQPELPPSRPREPLLTLPPALTVYILLLAIIHLRVLLPDDLQKWTVAIFGFIPGRYDSTLLADTGTSSHDSLTSELPVASSSKQTGVLHRGGGGAIRAASAIARRPAPDSEHVEGSSG